MKTKRDRLQRRTPNSRAASASASTRRDPRRRQRRLRSGCRPRIVKPKNLQWVDFQRLFKSGLRRFKAEIGDFVTKRRSGRGFWPASGGGGGGKKRMLQTARCGRMLVSTPNIILMSVSQLSNRLSPFGVPRRDRRGVPVLRGPRRGRTRTKGARGVRRRRTAQAAHGARSGGTRQVRRRTGTTVRFAGTVGFSTGPPKRRRKPFTPCSVRSRSPRSLYRSPGGPSFSPVDESLGLFDNWVRRRTALSRSCAIARRRTEPKSSKGWGA